MSGIFVTGLPRSGTSLIAGLLNRCGAWLGSTVPGDNNNPEGYFENIHIREKIIKQTLVKMGCDPLGVRSLPPFPPKIEITNFSEVFLSTIKSDGYEPSLGNWLYKDAKLLLVWPEVAKAFPECSWVLVRRNLQQFINSCSRTSFMAQHSTEKSFWLDIAAEYLIRLDALRDSQGNTYEVWPDEILNGNYSSLKELICNPPEK